MTEQQMAAYTITEDALLELLTDAIGMFIEFEEVHGYEREQAVFAGAWEEIEGLRASVDLMRDGELDSIGDGIEFAAPLMDLDPTLTEWEALQDTGGDE